MNDVDTKELIECYKKVLDYLKTLDNKKKEIEKDNHDA